MRVPLPFDLCQFFPLIPLHLGVYLQNIPEGLFLGDEFIQPYNNEILTLDSLLIGVGAVQDFILDEPGFNGLDSTSH